MICQRNDRLTASQTTVEKFPTESNISWFRHIACECVCAYEREIYRWQTVKTGMISIFVLVYSSNFSQSMCCVPLFFRSTLHNWHHNRENHRKNKIKNQMSCIVRWTITIIENVNKMKFRANIHTIGYWKSRVIQCRCRWLTFCLTLWLILSGHLCSRITTFFDFSFLMVNCVWIEQQLSRVCLCFKAVAVVASISQMKFCNELMRNKK